MESSLCRGEEGNFYSPFVSYTRYRIFILTHIQPYEDRAARDKARYIEEYTTVYGTAPQFQKRAKNTT